MQQEVKTQIYSGMFMHLQPLIKKRIIEIFNIPKNGATHVVDSTVYSDGYLDRDLAVLNVETLGGYLKSEEPDLFTLWNTLIKKIEKETSPKEEVPVEKEKVTMTVKVDGEDVVLEGNTKKDAKVKKDSNKN